MKKFIISIIFFPISMFMMGMNEVPPTKTLIWNKISYDNNALPDALALFDCLSGLSLENSTVLDDDGIPEIAEHLAQRASMVHSDTSWRPNFNPELYTHHKLNIIFGKPRDNTYDIVTVTDNVSTETKDRLYKTLSRNRSYLKESGKLFIILRTSENKKSIIKETISKLYPGLYEAMSPEKKELVLQKAHPNVIKFFPDYKRNDVEEACTSMGYNIISYQRKIYNILIHDRERYKKYLKCLFVSIIENFGLSPECTKTFQSSFINQVIGQLSQDDSGHLIYPVDITELQLCKGMITITISTDLFNSYFNPK